MSGRMSSKSSTICASVDDSDNDIDTFVAVANQLADVAAEVTVPYFRCVSPDAFWYREETADREIVLTENTMLKKKAGRRGGGGGGGGIKADMETCALLCQRASLHLRLRP